MYSTQANAGSCGKIFSCIVLFIIWRENTSYFGKSGNKRNTYKISIIMNKFVSKFFSVYVIGELHIVRFAWILGSAWIPGRHPFCLSQKMMWKIQMVPKKCTFPKQKWFLQWGSLLPNIIVEFNILLETILQWNNDAQAIKINNWYQL